MSFLSRYMVNLDLQGTRSTCFATSTLLMTYHLQICIPCLLISILTPVRLTKSPSFLRLHAFSFLPLIVSFYLNLRQLGNSKQWPLPHLRQNLWNLHIPWLFATSSRFWKAKPNCSFSFSALTKLFNVDFKLIALPISIFKFLTASRRDTSPSLSFATTLSLVCSTSFALSFFLKRNLRFMDLLTLL